MALNLSRNTSVFVSTGNGVHASGGSVLSVDGFTGGSGHAVGDVLTLGTTSGSGTGLKVVVNAVNSGAVTSVALINNFRGTAFVNNETATQTASTGTGTSFALVVDGVSDLTAQGSRLPTGLFKGNGADANTFKLGVLDGYSFSQGSDATDVTISEAGAAPNRGSKRFNDSLPPAEWSFQTYVRPFKHGTNSHRSSGTHDMVENILWAAIAGKDITGGSESGTSATAVTCDGTDADVSFARSDHHELLKLSIFFALENTTYRLNECQVNQAEIDFSIDGIATISWSGNATTIDQVSTAVEDPSKAITVVTDGTETISSASTYTEAYNYVDTTAPSDGDYLRNKLSTLSLTHTKNASGVLEVGASDSTTTYDINITGGSLTIANNITYVTPETLGLVDVPVGSFSGARQVSGSLTMYLDTKANGSNSLLSDLTAATDLVNNAFDMSLFMGGGSSSTPVVEFDLPKAHLQIPTIETADIISTTVEFAAQGTDLLTGDEMTVKYKGLTSHSDSTYTTDVTV
ncbi:hypothetical protein OAA25_00350 [bacterium]|nr:hypothetical protein [bacterium]